MLEATAGMYGDLQGIAGQSIQEVEGLSLELIEGPAGGTDGSDVNETGTQDRPSSNEGVARARKASIIATGNRPLGFDSH